MLTRCLFAVFLSLTLLGCSSEPRLDTADEAAVGSSLKAMRKKLPEDDQKQLARDISTASMLYAHDKKRDPKAPAAGATEALKPLNGMTAKQIHEKVEEFRKAAAPPESK